RRDGTGGRLHVRDRLLTPAQRERPLPRGDMPSPQRLPSSRLDRVASRLLVAGLIACACHATTAVPHAQPVVAPVGSGPAARLSGDARTIADWVIATRDARGLPFVIVDKRHATVSAFDAS